MYSPPPEPPLDIFGFCGKLRIPLATPFLVSPLQTYRTTTTSVAGSLLGHPLMSLGFVARPVRVRFIVDEKALGQDFLQVIPLSRSSVCMKQEIEIKHLEALDLQKFKDQDI